MEGPRVELSGDGFVFYRVAVKGSFPRDDWSARVEGRVHPQFSPRIISGVPRREYETAQRLVHGARQRNRGRTPRGEHALLFGCAEIREWNWPTRYGETADPAADDVDRRQEVFRDVRWRTLETFFHEADDANRAVAWRGDLWQDGADKRLEGGTSLAAEGNTGR